MTTPQERSGVEPQAVTDIFSGPGGMGTGFSLAGFHITEAVDISNVACRTYQSNHPETKVINRDIRDISYARGDSQGKRCRLGYLHVETRGQDLRERTMRRDRIE
jgi:predicted RNA methylase